MSKFVSSVFLIASLMTPVALLSQDHHDEDHDKKSYYDSSHKDRHEWNANEDREYHEYLKEHHKKEHDWSKASKAEQNDYWNWRHEHPDSH